MIKLRNILSELKLMDYYKYFMDLWYSEEFEIAFQKIKNHNEWFSLLNSIGIDDSFWDMNYIDNNITDLEKIQEEEKKILYNHIKKLNISKLKPLENYIKKAIKNSSINEINLLSKVDKFKVRDLFKEIFTKIFKDDSLMAGEAYTDLRKICDDARLISIASWRDVETLDKKTLEKLYVDLVKFKKKYNL